MVNVLLGPVNGKAKEKERKEPSRQSTLFGLPLGPSTTEKRGRKKKKKITDDSSPAQGDDEGSGENTPAAAPAPVSSSQASDVTMAEGTSEAATLVETQPIDQQYESQQASQDVFDDMNEVRVLRLSLHRHSD